VKGEECVSARLTPDAYARGFALALPKEVAVPALPTRGGNRRGSKMVLARPTGVKRAIPIPMRGARSQFGCLAIRQRAERIEVSSYVDSDVNT